MLREQSKKKKKSNGERYKNNRTIKKQQQEQHFMQEFKSMNRLVSIQLKAFVLLPNEDKK